MIMQWWIANKGGNVTIYLLCRWNCFFVEKRVPLIFSPVWALYLLIYFDSCSWFVFLFKRGKQVAESETDLSFLNTNSLCSTCVCLWWPFVQTAKLERPLMLIWIYLCCFGSVLNYNAIAFKMTFYKECLFYFNFTSALSSIASRLRETFKLNVSADIYGSRFLFIPITTLKQMNLISIYTWKQQFSPPLCT